MVDFKIKAVFTNYCEVIDEKTVRRDCSDLLELSDPMNICSYTVRDFYQERLTLLIEQIGYYIKAAELIENELENISEETSTKFIDNLLKKLRLSGFVHHPTKNFNILSCIFQRRPELMNSRMKELLDIIIGKDIRIWKRDLTWAVIGIRHKRYDKQTAPLGNKRDISRCQ